MAAYIAASGNRFSHAADSSTESLVAFGSSKFVALWSPKNEYDYGVSQTLPGHEGVVTCVRFIDKNTIVSGDEKGKLLLWNKSGPEARWSLGHGIQAHSKPVSAITVFRNFLATGASDSVVKIWEIAHDEKGVSLHETQLIPLKNRFPLALALGLLPKSSVQILAIGGTDHSVQLWLKSEGTFVHSAKLAGHEDWIRALDFDQGDRDQPLVLASGSQDSNIRLWNIEPLILNTITTNTGDLEDNLLEAFEASLGDVAEGEEGGKQISLKRHILTTKTSSSGIQQYSVTFDALLVGHEAGITSLRWKPRTQSAAAPALLSTSTDSSVILWAPSESTITHVENGPSLWVNFQRFGDVGGQRLGGFVGGLWGNTGKDVLAWGWSGGWRHWLCKHDSAGPLSESWHEVGAITGHGGPVKGLDWSPNGDYLISSGLDQTTRIHGGIPVSNPSVGSSWHELSRPQIHGYDLLNVVFVDQLKFASIADEKVVRAFEAPRSFVEMFQNLKVSKFSEEEHLRPAGASVPALGLSNKAIGEGTSQALAIWELDVSRRPFEGELASSTLWPEVEKIFGHGYESMTLGISNSHRFIATSCKATSSEHAVVRVYDTQTFRAFGNPLSGHSLTVTRISFSPDDKLALTVSRDRSWRLFELQGNSEFVFIAADRSHGRIIWDCAWSPEGDFFATASRDKTVKIWQPSEEGNHSSWSAVTTIKTPEAATAVAISSTPSKRCLAIGLDNGHIMIYSSLDNAKSWKQDSTIDSRVAHVDHIHRLAWRPMTTGSTQIASCSEDGTLRILNIQFDTD